MPDFGLLGQMPNFAQAALSGFQAGQNIAKQRQLDAAMQNVDLERPETLLPILRADPSTGAALIGASVKLSAQKRDDESRLATANYIKMMAGGSAGSGTTPAAAAPGAANPAPAPAPTASLGSDGDLAVTSPTPQPAANPQAPQPGDVVVTAQPQGTPQAAAQDPNAIRNAAIDADPTGFLDIQSKIGAMDEAGRKRLAAATDSFATLGQQLLQIPYQQRPGYIQAHAADLLAHGIPAQKIQSFDPTDQNIHYEVGQALGTKAQLEQADKDRSFGLDQQRFTETVHHNRVDESQGASRIGLEAQSVGIAGGHLALARNADAREAAKTANGGFTPPVVAPRYEYRTVNGVVQRRLAQ